MKITAAARTNERCLGDFCGGVAGSGALRATGPGRDASGSGTGAAAACGDGLIWATRSATVGRLAGLRFKHRRTMPTNVGGRVVGNEAAADLLSGHAGG